MVDIVIVGIFLQYLFQLVMVQPLTSLVAHPHAHSHILALSFELTGRTLKQASPAYLHISSVIAFFEVRHGHLLIGRRGQKRQRKQGIVKHLALAVSLFGWLLAHGVDTEVLDEEGTGVRAVFEARI